MSKRWQSRVPRKWTAVKEWMSFRSKWRVVSEEAARITVAIAADQVTAWAIRPDGRHRSLALRGWSDMLRSMVPACRVR